MFSPTFQRRMLGAALVTLVAACSDASIPTGPTARLAGGNTLSLSEGQGAFQRYVAIGTSLSMGVMGDGTIAASQEQAWPAQLSRMAGREMSLPLIGGTGCRSPFAVPLASG